ncbi:MAG: tetratricopeptide repeat protein, partial [Pseudomonadota bacterium]|nr:tetratricopeptide repeat protein [Pseudomonadota bacterium]
LQLQPKIEYGYLALASLHEALDELDEAKVYLRKLAAAVAKPSLSWRYYLLRARINLTPDTVDRSLAMLRTALLKQDALMAVVVPHVILLLEFKHADNLELLPAAIEHWRQLRPHPLYRQYLATFKLEQGDYRQALLEFKSILASDPTNNNAKLNIALISYKYLNQQQEAKAIFTALAEDASISKQEQSALSVHLGNIFLQEKNYPKAQKHFIRTLTSHADGSMMLEYVFVLYHSQGLHRQLTSLIKKLNIEMPGYPRNYALLGDLYADYIKDYPSAIEAYSNALLLDPSLGKLYSALGLSYYKLNNLDQALTMFRKARTYDSSDAVSFYNEACVYALLQRKHEALASLQRAIELDEGLKHHAIQDADFDNIRSLPMFDTIVLN